MGLGNGGRVRHFVRSLQSRFQHVVLLLFYHILESQVALHHWMHETAIAPVEEPPQAMRTWVPIYFEVQSYY